jgi:hypothetical protein
MGGCHVGDGLLIEGNNVAIFPSHDQQCGASDLGQCLESQIWSASPAHKGLNVIGPRRRRDQ